MQTRREMIESVLAFSMWPRLRPIAATPLPQTAYAAAPDDEAFWAHVRSQFELVPEVANLVSVVRGKLTKGNHEISNEAIRLNQGPAPLPDSDQQREIRKKAAGFIGAPTEHIALLRNTTEGVTTFLAKWPLLAGDEILTSSAEHGPFYDALARRAARDHVVVRKVFGERRVRNGRTESFAGFFGIPEKAPRFLFIANTAPFPSIADVDRLADAIEATAKAS